MHLMFAGQRVLSTNSGNSVRCNMWGINERVRNKAVWTASSSQGRETKSQSQEAASSCIASERLTGRPSADRGKVYVPRCPAFDGKSTETTSEEMAVLPCLKGLYQGSDRDMRVCSGVQSSWVLSCLHAQRCVQSIQGTTIPPML